MAGCITSKAVKRYPFGTALIVQCITNTLTLEEEWRDAVERVRRMQIRHLFREVFLLESVGLFSATLYGQGRR